MLIEERVKKMKRALKSLRESYSGPVLKFDDLNENMKVKVLVKLSQVINTERNSKNPCSIYPTEQFASYGECDRIFFYEKVLQNFGLIPFWTANTLDDVTIQKYLGKHPREMNDFFDGTEVSSCLKPCLSTKVVKNSPLIKVEITSEFALT